MPDQPIDKARKLQKLGERIRDGFSKENPTPDRSLDTVRQTIRQEWEKERTSKSHSASPLKGRGIEPNEPDQDR